MENLERNQAITWFTINNLVPLITSAVMITVSFAALNTRLSVLESKMDTLIALQEKTDKVATAKFYDIETRYGQLTLKVQALETMHNK